MPKKLGKLSRSVSIIGVGCTPFMETLANPETQGLCAAELFGWAALDAMADAGVESKDVDTYFHGEAAPFYFSDIITPNMHVAEWFGMRGKPSAHHSEACCSGYIALDLAVNAVAAGKHDIVLSGCVEMTCSKPVRNKPAHMREYWGGEDFVDVLATVYDKAYTRFLGAGPLAALDNVAAWYCREYGLTDEQMDDVLNALAINLRRGAARHPLAFHQKEYKDIAEEAGFDDVMAYMKSYYNPKLSEYLRASGFETRAEGAAAVIVCPTEMAKAFKQQPIEVLGIGAASLEGGHPHLERKGTEEALRQVYQVTGVKPDEIDLLMSNDFFITSGLLAGELSGYLPRGKGWQYILDGRTAFDGDKPINPNGGRTSFGHAYAASGLADHYEAVKQMRRQCGDRQVKKLPETTVLRGFGGGQNVTAAILRTIQ
ncbi:MAG: thiolase family protein [Desulfatitalea sp.]|nr:thiolase family protein [Desulfatitalea sp.]NNK00249.1 thiolase family protein [Desulfatitalea sp.]